MKNLLIRFSILGTVCLFLVGCPIGPSSRIYKPISEWEEDAFKRADRAIFPNDIRQNDALLDSVRIAWPGIILDVSYQSTDSGLQFDFLIEHHFYDWIEDFSIQQEKIFLSPQGEGNFKTSWRVKPDTDTTKLDSIIGNMIIVYGRPISINDSIINVRAYYIREIDKQWFATDIFDYGRPGSSMKILRIPGFK